VSENKAASTPNFADIEPPQLLSPAEVSEHMILQQKIGWAKNRSVGQIVFAKRMSKIACS
jgi:hypothetical protein